MKILLPILLICLLLCACERETISPKEQGPFYLQKVEIVRASTHDGRALPLQQGENIRLFLRFGQYKGAYPEYQSTRSRRVTELPVTWGFEEDSIRVPADTAWVIALYSQDRSFNSELLFHTRLTLPEFNSPVSLKDTRGIYHVDLYYGPSGE
jgi:hypothetical protein